MNNITIINKVEEVNKFFSILPQPSLLPSSSSIISAMEEVLWERICEHEGFENEEVS